MEFEEKVTVRQIKRILHDPSAHVEQRYGTAKEAIEYCKKDNKFMEFGKPKAQGERTDLADVYESLKVGRSLQDIIEEHPGTYIRYFRGIERVQDIFRRKQQKLEERVQPTVIVYVGRSGTGKSHHCYHDPDYQASGYKFPVEQSGKVYFDGYDGESSIWFDEFGDPYCLLEYSFDYATNWRHLWKRRDLPYASPISERYLSQQPRILRTGGEILESIRKIQDSCGDDSPTCSTSRTSCLSTPNPSRSESQITSEMKWPKNWIDVLKSGEDGDQEMQRWKESEATNPATQLLSTIVAMMGLSNS